METEQQLLRDDQSARRSALDISRSFIVQAPAGSGKTELLIQRYLKLLSIVDDPEEILAITFTRKASAEMQLRVLDALRRRQRGDVPAEEHQQRTSELASAALARSVQLDWNLIGNPNRMRILTLDALNAYVARAQPLHGPMHTGGARVVVDAELKSTHRAAAIATLDWLVDESGTQVAIRQILQHLDNNTDLYISYVSRTLATRDQWLPFVGSGRLSDDEAKSLRSKFEESLEFAVVEQLRRTRMAFADSAYADIESLLDYAATNLVAIDKASNPICSLAGLTEYPKADVQNIDGWLGIAELLLTGGGAFRKKVDKRQGFPPDNKERKAQFESVLTELAKHPEMSEILHSVRTLPPIRYPDEQWDILLALFRLLPVAVTELQRLFAEQGVIDHVEVALNAGAALGTADQPGDIALLLDYRVRHLLVDEMQDTSSAQYKMIESITGGWEPGDARTLFCVGDPMQSIYRFRNAEVGQFLLARKHGIGAIHLESLVLRQNFRSGGNLVSWFNEVFPSILAVENNPSRGAVAYSESVAAEHLVKQGSCEMHPVFGSDASLEAAAGRNVISNILDEHPDDGVVVLVRARSHLPQLLGNLRRAGILYQSVEIDRLTDLPEILDVLALTRAAAHQGDRMAWLGILRAPWIGMSWSDLHGLVTNDTKSTVWELLNDDVRLQALSPESRSVLARKFDVLRTLVQPRRSQCLRDLIERCWIALGGPAALEDEFAVENVYRYFDVIARLERAGTLPDVAELESTLDLERVSSNSNARLQVMTMHRAKGLQFDHVLLYGLGRAPGRGDRRVLSWFDSPERHGIEHKIISPIGPRAEIDRDPVHRFIDVVESEKSRNEQARLLYVASTRARKSLQLMGNVNVTTDGDSYRQPRRNSLLQLLWPFVESRYATAFESHTHTNTQTEKTGLQQPLRRRLSADWKMPEISALPGAASVDERVEPDAKVEFYWVGAEARIAGTLVHRWLHNMVDDEVSNTFDDLSLLPLIASRWLREMGIGERSGRSIVKRIEKAIRGVLDDSKGRWILAGEGHAELALSGMIDGELATVILDRVRIDDDGTHWIIDYKTSSHEGGNLEKFLSAETDRYRPQLARYASIYNAWANTDARCALYFPLLQSFVEVAV